MLYDCQTRQNAEASCDYVSYNIELLLGILKVTALQNAGNVYTIHAHRYAFDARVDPIRNLFKMQTIIKRTDLKLVN